MIESVHSRLTTPTYAVADAARLVGMTPGRVSRWLRGYQYHSDGRLRRLDPVIGSGRRTDSPNASFLDLVDLVFVKRFLEAGMSLQQVRGALDEARQILGTEHFAREVFFADGSGLFLQIEAHGEAGGKAILELMTGGQWTIAPIIRELARQVDFGGGDRSGVAGGFALRWHPLGRNTPIVIDPLIAFGAPSLAGRGVKTANVFDLFIAERESVDAVRAWWNLTADEVDAAVQFERGLAA